MFYVDAIISKTNLFEFTVDAGLLESTEFEFTVDAIVDEVEGKIDICLVCFETPPQPTNFFTVDAVVVDRPQFTFQVDGRVVIIPKLDFTVDAIVKKLGATNNFSVDAFLGKFARLVHTSIIRDNLKVISVIRSRE